MGPGVGWGGSPVPSLWVFRILPKTVPSKKFMRVLKMGRIAYYTPSPVTENTLSVTDIQRAVTEIKQAAHQAAEFGHCFPDRIVSQPIPVRRGRGRPRTGVAVSDADRARKYRERRRGAVAAS
jgi:hypothetical protein